jgi:hypothetical protein
VCDRVVDPESDGKLAHMPYNLELQGLYHYLGDVGRDSSGFRQPSPVQIIQ